MICKDIVLFIFAIVLVDNADAVKAHRRPTRLKNEKPNIIFIMADDLGYNDIGYHNPEVLTPCLDKLAREGMILESSYVLNVCTPTRHALMTGRYPFQDRMGNRVINRHKFCSPTNIKFLPERLKELDYQTLLIGKWHLGHCQKDCLPVNRGFDTFFGLYRGSADFFTHVNVAFDWWDQDQPYFEADGVYTTHLINDRTICEIEKLRRNKPFFAFISHAAPHFPLQVPERYANLYPDISGERKILLGMMSAMDESVCNLTKTLEQKKLMDNTLIIFSSDNGGDFGDAASNLPLRGGKLSNFEGGVRVPNFVYGPEFGIPKGTVNTGLFHVTDWVPTLLSLAGGEVDEFIDGVDQSKMLLENKPSARQEVVLNIDMHPNCLFGQAAVRRGPYKLLWGTTGLTIGRGNTTLQNRVPETFEDLRFFNPNDALDKILADPSFFSNFDEFNTAVTTAYAQYVGFNDGNLDKGLVHLFNIDDDPNETTNLADDPAYADKVKELKYMIFNELHRHRLKTREEEIQLSRPEVTRPDPRNPRGVLRSDFCEGQDIKV